MNAEPMPLAELRIRTHSYLDKLRRVSSDNPALVAEEIASATEDGAEAHTITDKFSSLGRSYYAEFANLVVSFIRELQSLHFSIEEIPNYRNVYLKMARSILLPVLHDNSLPSITTFGTVANMPRNLLRELQILDREMSTNVWGYKLGGDLARISRAAFNIVRAIDKRKKYITGSEIVRLYLRGIQILISFDIIIAYNSWLLAEIPLSRSVDINSDKTYLSALDTLMQQEIRWTAGQLKALLGEVERYRIPPKAQCTIMGGRRRTRRSRPRKI